MDKLKQKTVNFLKKHNYFGMYTMILLGISLIPLLWIGKYNIMSADDYAMGKECHLLWKESRNVFSVISYAFRHTWETYRTWQGCFTINFLDSLNPAFLNERLTWITPVEMLASILLSTYFFTHSVLKKYYSVSRKEISVIWGVLSLLLIQTMPSPVEGIYWYAGAIAYTFLHFLMLLLYCLLIATENQKNKYISGFLGVFTVAYAFFVGGSQYITVLECLLWYLIFLLLNRKSLRWWKIMPGISLLCGFCLNLLAPGNGVRQQEAVGINPISAVFSSFLEALRYMKQWVTPVFVVAVLFLFPIIWGIVKRQRGSHVYKHPLIVLLGSYCFFSASFTPALYGVGNVDAGRIQNLIQSLFYMLALIDIFYITGWLQYQMAHSHQAFWKDALAVKDIIKKYQWIYQWIAFVGIFAVILCTGDKNTFSSVSALRSLVIGEAEAYYEEAQERLAIYQNEEVEIAQVTAFDARPYVLYFTDIVKEECSNYWINENIADYYGKVKVILIE